MSLVFRKNLFFLVISLLFLLSFLLAETYLGFYVLGLFGLVLLGFRRTFPVKKSVSGVAVGLSLLFLVLSSLTLFTTISLPLSLYALIRYAFLVAFFLYFLRLDFDDQEKSVLFQLLIFQGLSLVLVSAMFFFLPEYGNKIPGMNVIFSTFGHNHLGALMLLLTPLAFWLYLKEKRPWYLAVFGIFVLAMVLSFGRVVIFIGLLELIVLGYFYLRWKKLKLKSLPGLLFLLLSALLLSSLVFYIYTGHADVCLVEDEVYREQVCKTDLRKNVRQFYWDQAWQAFRDRPAMGYGIGTFGSISYLYRQVPEFRSSYAHNDYLQFFAEGGILVGASFIGLLSLLYWGTFLASRRSEQLLLFLGLAAFGVDLFFDFDLNFFGMTLLFFLLFALLFKSHTKFTWQIATKRLEPIVFALLIGVLLTTGLYVVTDRLVAAGREETVSQYFPYFHWHSLNFMKSEKIPSERKRSLAQLYWSSPETLTLWIGTLTGDEKAKEEYQSWLVDPWRRAKSFLPAYYFEKKDVQALTTALTEIDNFLAEKRTKYNYPNDNITYIYKAQWSRAYVFLAQQALAEKNYAQAARFLQRSYYFEEWIIAHSPLLFAELVQLGYQPEMKDLLRLLEEIPAVHFGNSRSQLARLYFEQVLFLLHSGEDDETLKSSAQQVLSLAEWDAYWFRTEIFVAGEKTWDQFITQDNWQDFYRYSIVLDALQVHPFGDRSSYTEAYHQLLISDWFSSLQQYIDRQLALGNEEAVGQFLDALVQNIHSLNGMYWVQAQRGYFYGLTGDYDKATQAFAECLAINPEHSDCQHGLANLNEKGYADIGRYYEIRQLLLEK